jgi:hypothetical protein
VVGVEQWAEIRRLVLVEQCSQRQVAKSLGLARATVARALASDSPPKFERAVVGSKLDPFKEWICEQLQADPSIQSLRLREMAGEMGYAGGKSIFDDYVRDVRPRFQVRRTFQRTIYRPGELVQCDLWEPRELIAVGHAQQRRGYVVTAELCWSRVIAGALVFSKEAPDILWGLGRCLARIGVLPQKLERSYRAIADAISSPVTHRAATTRGPRSTSTAAIAEWSFNWSRCMGEWCLIGGRGHRSSDHADVERYGLLVRGYRGSANARVVKADRKLGHSRRLKTRPPRRLLLSPARELRGERPSSRGRARRARPWRRWSL